ncbi:MAG: DUF2520 domain-containing protein [Bacteroidia bacterium]|jgi:predicted short-subunit dehydrogenase-like oxidoreductase (DUF2520 family)|nr:DUF2520 domain-containing protein [Bacteroidia bacterium]
MHSLSGKKVVLLGAGNVAWHLGRALRKSGAEIVQVWSRNPKHARRLARMLGATPAWDDMPIKKQAHLYLIAVKDDAIAQTVARIPKGNGITVHTAGSVSIDVLAQAATKYTGVIWPLQSLTAGHRINFRKVPLCVETSCAAAAKALSPFVHELSESVTALNSEQRAHLHLAAVLVNNFSNHLFALAEKVTATQHIPFEILRPIIAETAAKVQHLSPTRAQTGPALRNDKQVMQRHLQLIGNDKDLRQLYQLISKSISKHPH